MHFFEGEKEVNEYIAMNKGYDGKELIEILKNNLKVGSSILELGIGLGKDLDILSKTYRATGSDFSSLFLSLYQKDHPNADLLLLDAVELNTKHKFDCVYSNKVLHHFSREDLIDSFNKQLKILNDGGLIFHSFWNGNKEENHHGLRVIYYTIENMKKIIPSEFEIIEMETYKEIKNDDSLYIILKKK